MARARALTLGQSKASDKQGLSQSLALWCAFYRWDKGHGRKQLGEERLSLLGLCFRALPEGLETRTEAQTMRNTAHCTAPPGLLSLLSDTTQAHLPKGGTAPVDRALPP